MRRLRLSIPICHLSCLTEKVRSDNGGSRPPTSVGCTTCASRVLSSAASHHGYLHVALITYGKVLSLLDCYNEFRSMCKCRASYFSNDKLLSALRLFDFDKDLRHAI
jgi:hypothetical protein